MYGPGRYDNLCGDEDEIESNRKQQEQCKEEESADNWEWSEYDEIYGEI